MIKPLKLQDCSTIRKPARYELEKDFVQYEAPACYRDAVSCAETELWKEAIANELKAHKENQTWTIVSRFKSQSVIEPLSGFSRSCGTPKEKFVDSRRGCVPRGFKQKYDVNYIETFSVIRYDSL